MRALLREVDRHAFSMQTAQLTRTRHYSDDFTIHIQHPRNAPDWTFVDQNTPTGTDFFAFGTEIKDQDNYVEEEK